MKRSLITAAALYLLYDRQRRVERRQKLWKLRTEAELRHFGTEIADSGAELTRWTTETLKEWAEKDNAAHKRFCEEIEGVMKGAR